MAVIQWGLAGYVAHRVAEVSGYLGAFLSNRLRAISGRAKRTSQRDRQAALLLSRREVLASEARRARRQHRPAKPIYSAARSITHGILARGVRNG